MSVFNEALEWEDHAEQIDVGRNVMAANSGAAAADASLNLQPESGRASSLRLNRNTATATISRGFRAAPRQHDLSQQTPRIF